MTHPPLQPTLIGETIEVRPLRADDWDGMYAAASDPGIWELHPVPERYTEPVFRKFFDEVLASGAAFTVVERAGGRIIGSSRYNGYDPQLSEIEIGWTFLVRRHWGGQTNAELKRLMLDHAFTFCGTVIFWVGETNWRSQGAMAKIGGVKRAGLFRRAPTGAIGGTAHPHVIFEITSKRWRDISA